ncbi:Predicted arabinose efflux permease, MFS family [Actinacidiphila alni]|uniref:Predicted arabinose efflux permease, MFS family n=1 Tax=Actinacidiphila alni TaxID=380248 RepID=A0A1I2CFH7_9ACTN|nr:MFS transporter [Actinacidiphila alni]SFE67071.1 Predicted arabinose efflux permease, MFS family [Actinacidiphila alni]
MTAAPRTGAPDAPPAGGAADPARWDARLTTVLLILSGNMILDAIEVSLVLVALPSIGDALDLGLWTVQWLMSGFALGFAALLLIGPRLNARLGRRRVYLGAMLLFAAASVVGGLTDSAALLIATRVVKGLSAALTAPTGLAIIGTAFPAGPRQRRAVSVYALFGAAGFTAGLLLSGALLNGSWRWTFLFPAPVALILLVFGLRVIPPDRGRTPAPRITPTLLRDRALLRSAIGATTLNGTYQSLLLLLVFRTQRQLGWSPWQSAVALLPACVPLAVTVPFAGALVARWGTGRLIALGATAPLLGYAYFLWRAGAGAYATGTLPTLLLVGAGFVLSFAALNIQATGALPPAERAAAVPLFQTAVQLGAVVMLPATAALLGAHHGSRPALALITAVAVVGLLAALPGLRTPAASPSAGSTPSPTASPPALQNGSHHDG